MSALSSSRRGDFNILIALIGIVIVGIVLVIISTNIIRHSNTANKDEACRLSFLSAHSTETLKRKSVNVLDFKQNLNCEAKEVIIGPKEVRRGLFGRIDDDLVKQKIADEMMRCWSLTGSGKLKIFQNVQEGFLGTFGSQKACLVCSTIKFSDDFIKTAKKEGYKLQDVYKWFATSPIKPEGKPLLEIMLGRSLSTDEVLDHSKTKEYVLDNNHIVFFRDYIETTATSKVGNSFVYFRDVSVLSSSSGDEPVCTMLLN